MLEDEEFPEDRKLEGPPPPLPPAASARVEVSALGTQGCLLSIRQGVAETRLNGAWNGAAGMR